MNACCQSHRKVQSELNNQDTGIYFIVKSNGTGLRKEKYRLTIKKKKTQMLNYSAVPLLDQLKVL